MSKLLKTLTNREIGVARCGLTQQQIITLHELNILLKRETHWEHSYLNILCERIKCLVARYQRVSIVVEQKIKQWKYESTIEDLDWPVIESHVLLVNCITSYISEDERTELLFLTDEIKMNSL